MNVGLVTADNGEGGAARAVRRLATGLTQRVAKVDSIDLVCRGRVESGYHLVQPKYKLQNQQNRPDKLLYETLEIKAQGWWQKYIKPADSYDFFPEGYTLDIKKTLENYDVLNLFWYQTLGRIKQIKKLDKPTIITLHDMWFLTGGCAYSYSCQGYKTGCKKCDYVAKRSHDQISKQYEDKIGLINDENCRIVVTSEWMKKKAIETGIEEHKISKIANHIPNNFCYMNNKEKCMKVLGWEIDKKDRIYYFVGNTADKRKGFEQIMDAIADIRESERKHIKLQILGNLSIEYRLKMKELRIEWKELGSYKDELSQIIAYNASDCLICPSLFDNSPNVIAEAQCCGVPTIAKEKTGAAEMINDGMDGLVYKKDGISLKECMEEIQKGRFDNESNRISSESKQKYGFENTCGKYMKLYREVHQ